MFDLTGKKALITGASGGIGAAIAELFSQQGAFVVLHGTREERLKTIQASLSGPSLLLPANLSKLEEVAKIGQIISQEIEGVDIIINNAGITRDGLFIRMKPQDWQEVLDINLTAVFALTQSLVPYMMKQREGRIINISSVVGVTGNPGQTNYCATKAGIIGFSKALALELASRQITVNAIAPGFIQTDMTNKLNDKQKDAILASIPMKKMGNPGDIAKAALYLASREAAYVTGQTLHINGGLAMI